MKIRALILLITIALCGNCKDVSGQTKDPLDSLIQKSGSATGKELIFKSIEIGLAFYDRGDMASYARALDWFVKAQKEAARLNNPALLAESHYYVGLIYDTRNDDFPKALTAYKSAYEESKKAQNNLLQARSLHSVATIYLKMDSLPQAELSAKQALTLSATIEPNKNIYYLTNLATIYKKQGKAAQSDELLREALQIAVGQKDTTAINRCYSVLSVNHYEAGEYRLAEIYFRKWLPVLDTANLYNRRQLRYYRAKTLAALKDSSAAYVSMADAYAANDSICSEFGQKTLNEMRARFEAYQKEQENERLKQEAEIRNGWLWLSAVAAALAALAAAFVFFYFRFRAREARNNQLFAEQNNALLQSRLQVQEAEAQKISREKQLAEAEASLSAALAQEEKRKRELAETQNRLLEEETKLKNAQAELERKTLESEMAVSAYRLSERQAVFKEIRQRLDEILDAPVKDRAKALQNLKRALVVELSERDDWEVLKNYFNQTHQGFFDRLTEKHENLSVTDLKLCAFILMNKSSKEIAELLGIETKSVETARWRLRKKLSLENNEGLREYLQLV